MSQIIETIDVDVPVRTAYDQWTQLEEFPRFLDEVQSVVQQDDTHVHWKVQVGGQEREFDTVITEQHADERVAWTSTGGEVDHAGVVTFHTLSDTTSRLAVQIDWEPESLLEKVGAAVGAPKLAVQHALRHFKTYIEGKGVPDGGWRGDVEA